MTLKRTFFKRERATKTGTKLSVKKYLVEVNELEYKALLEYISKNKNEYQFREVKQ